MKLLNIAALLILTQIFTNSLCGAMSFDEFNLISGLLHANRMDAKMNCSIKAREIKEERHFSSGNLVVDYLQVNFTTAQLGPRSVEVSIPLSAKIEKKIVNHFRWGPVEQIKINLNDSKESWLQLQHNGSFLVQFEIYNSLAIYPCWDN